MAKNIVITPRVSVPNISFDNAGEITLTVTQGARINFNTSSQSNLLYIDISNKIISVGYILNVKDNLTVGGTQVINGTANWVGPTTGILGSQGAKGGTGAQGSVGEIGSTGAQGTQGPNNTTQGAQGATGNVQGAQGPQGNIGGTGAQGPQGAQGSAGEIGSTGAQGTQ